MSEWKKVRLGDVCRANVDTYSPAEGWSFINYLDTGSVTENHIAEIQRLDTTLDKIPSRARRKAHVGNIVYSTVRPNQRHYAILNSEPRNFLVSTGFAVLDVISYVANSQFVYYLLTQDSVVDHLQSVAEQSVSTYPSLNPVDILNLEVSLPPLPTQRKIAAVLGALDDKIENNRKICANLEAQAQAIFKSWFVDFEPFGGKMPQGWKMGKLGDVCKIFDSRRIPLSSLQRAEMQGDIPYYGATSIVDYVNDFLLEGIYLLMGEDGSVITDKGYPFLQYIWGKSWPNNHAHVLQGTNGYTTEMLYCLLSQTKVERYVTGAVQPKISQGNMIMIPACIPEGSDAKKFSGMIQPLFDELRCITDESRALAATRDTLLPKLMSGEIDVEKVKVA